MACFQQDGNARNFEAVMFDVLPLLVICAGASSAALDGFTELMVQVAHQCNPRKVIKKVVALLTEAARYMAHAVLTSAW